MELRVPQGSFLAAWPDLLDPNFMHSVVLMCRHDEHGAFGLVTNQKTEFRVGQLFPEHPLLGELEHPVHLGGPVDHQSLQVVHCMPDELSGGEAISAELWFGAELDSLARFLSEEPERARACVRLFLGYSGWGAGQLDEELTSGSWVPAPLDPDVVFAGESFEAWRQVVRSAGKDVEGLDQLPPDPSWN